MGISKTDKTGQGKISPPPIQEDVVNGGKATQPLVRFLLDLRKSGFNGYDEIDRVIDFANNIQEGAGLNEDGTYSPHDLANYISLATSLNNADLLLDAAIYKYTRELVTTVSGDTSLLPIAQTVLVNSLSGAISITLPPPSDCFDGNRSLRFAVHKIDSTNNIVTILPNGSESVVSEANQYMDLEGEILNFITDGTNWYLGA